MQLLIVTTDIGSAPVWLCKLCLFGQVWRHDDRDSCSSGFAVFNVPKTGIMRLQFQSLGY